MKRKFICCIGLYFLALVVSAQTSQPDSLRVQAYKAFIGQILGSNGSAITPSFSLTLDDNPAVNFALPLFPFQSSFAAYKQTQKDNAEWKAMTSGTFLAVTGNVGATNGYSPLIGAGKWTADVMAGLSLTQFLWRGVKFYTPEVERFPSDNPKNLTYIGPIDARPITEASQVNFIWLNMTGGYTRKTFSLFDTLSRSFSDAAYDQTLQGGYFSASINGYHFPSKYYTPWFSLYWQVGFNYDGIGTNSNNDTVSLNKHTIIQQSTNNNGTIIQSSKDVNSYDSSAFLHNPVITIPIQLTAIFSTTDQKFYMGIGPVVNFNAPIGKSLKIKSSVDAGFAVNVPISVGKGDDAKTVLNLALKFVWNDAGKSNKADDENAAKYTRNNFKVGFTATAPLIISHKRPADK